MTPRRVTSCNLSLYNATSGTMVIMHESERQSRREFFAGLSGLPFLQRAWALRLGDARFRVMRRGMSLRRYLHIHGDETTAREVLLAHMKTADGTAFLVQSQTRTVPIHGGKVDPNRVFSRAGAEVNLRTLNPCWSAGQVRAALDLLDRHRERLVQAITPPAGGLLIALHNNTSGYSVHDETPISDRVSLNRPDHPREFLLCTDALDFDILSTFSWNVVLQQHAPSQDDGSLSRLAAATGFRYLNIETPRGDLERQRRLLSVVDAELP